MIYQLPPRDDQAVILLYHGVTREDSQGIENFSGKHIDADVFDKQMAWVAQNTAPVSLRGLSSRLLSGEPLPPRSIAVTFDDSYRNLVTTALPILKRHRVPATFFITTGFVETARRYWTDKVEHIINMAEAHEVKLALSPNDAPSTFDLGTPEKRVNAVIEIKSAMKALPPEERDATLTALSENLPETGHSSPVPNYDNLSWDEVRELDTGDDYDVGGHSANHEILSYLEETDCVHELKTCIAALEDNLGHKIDLFSYPEGQESHYNSSVIKALKAFGISICPSAIFGYNQSGDDPFHLRRVMVGFMGTPFPWDYANS